MLLQRIEYPDSASLDNELYIKTEFDNITASKKCQSIEMGSSTAPVHFGTYFNSFSIKKWYKYTKIHNVKLEIEIQGCARVELFSLRLQGDKVSKQIEYSEVVENRQKKRVVFEYPSCVDADALSFNIVPISSEVCISNGAYLSDVDETAQNEVNLSVVICTYKREDYVTKNMQLLQREVFYNRESLLCDHLNIYIADNGRTLNAEHFSNEHIHLFPNKNSGGSGGFSRGAIEALNDTSHSVSHVIFMDDDIEFEVSSLERIYTFLTLLKDEYAENLLGGAMFPTDNRSVQYAAGETCTVQGFVFNKKGCDMRNIVDVMRNEIEESINYLGWWYCCIPAELLKKAGYSLPLFFQYDDIEFSLRNLSVPKITLNGICCWHIPFAKKMSGFKKYYNFRNKAIVSSIHFTEYSKNKLIKNLLMECMYRLLQYGYKEAELILLAAEDFLKGMSWLIKQNPEELNKTVISMDDKYVSLDALDVKIKQELLKTGENIPVQRLRKCLYLLGVKKVNLPEDTTLIIELHKVSESKLHDKKTVLKYDQDTGKGILVRKSIKKTVAITVRMVKDVVLIHQKFNAVVNEYKAMHKEATTEQFWRQYLDF